ncbi:MAG: sugar ABC transporter ATP-binding protein [Clostridia bacterium]|nr:sugar ABC transporter ATP-binding protein [Clostridia bacterium]
MSEYRLEMKNISKQFLSLKALDKVDFKLKRGEVHALLGINGAGKSTLIKVLSGVYSKDEGQVMIDGKLVEINDPKDAISTGISTVYQDPQMIESFTGYENIYLGSENDRKSIFSGLSRKQMRKNAQALLSQYPLEIDLDKKVYALSAIEREIIAVLRALSKQCKILILDEPTSILTEKEKHILFDVIKMLKQNGVSIIYITHHLDEVSQVCDQITVFRNGKNVAEVKVKNHQVNVHDIAELMLGEKLESLYPQKNKEYLSETMLEVKDLSLNGKFENVNFQVKKGEIYGIFGLVGSGIDEISKILFGAMNESSGKVYKSGKEINLKNPKAMIEEGVFLVPGDRKSEGQIGNFSIANNITIAKMKRVLNKIGLVKKGIENSEAEKMVNHLSIATTHIHKKVQELSGGNQQKVVIGKGLFTQADVYIFSEPTVGVDVGAKFAIYDTMRQLSKDAAVLIISSDPEEVIGNADRMMVVHKGKTTLKADAENTSLKEMLVCAVSDQELIKGGA